ncbi:universal stress protein [Tenggerimyces flavus]|uniref:universal stress protein n=1 Tax=Tenggerimyces flavus TaxID=1708749 RepID=UPI001EF96095|nr:universal stress protein [Tenggerimyces flavus]MBM7790361.1 K+-sensing histidine kinase KdpD [Tenggerimyces flavus]
METCSGVNVMDHMDQRIEQRVQSCPPAQRQPVLVVGYDRHPAAQRALRAAADLAVLLQAHVVVVHVVDAEDYPIDSDAADWEEHAEQDVTKGTRQCFVVRPVVSGLGPTSR